MAKRPFDIHQVLQKIAKAVEPYPPAALFGLADEGYGSAFEQLLACMISIRTKDEVTFAVSRRLFAQARTPEQILALGEEELDELIRPSMYHANKARQMQTIAQRLVELDEGSMPCEEATLLALPGIGPKCANLVLGIACGEPRIAVDIHVWRVTNRWGYIQASTPEKALTALEAKLPREHWTNLNRWLMPFGKHICTGVLPKCSTCPVLAECQQVGVTKHR